MNSIIESVIAILSDKVATTIGKGKLSNGRIEDYNYNFETNNGKLHGLCEISSWSCKIKCHYVNGLRHGSYKGKFSYTGDNEVPAWEEQRIICNYADDVLHGKYEEYLDDNKIISCSYVYGNKYGSYLENFMNGPCYIKCYYRDNKKYGEYIKNYNNGTTNIKCHYRDDMKNGEYMEFYANGVLSVYCSNYLDDKKHGTYATYNRSGNLDKEGAYENDIKQGIHKSYYHRYNSVLEEVYKDGVLQSSRSCTIQSDKISNLSFDDLSN